MLLSLIIVILRYMYVDGKPLQNVQRKCPVVKKETFLCSHFQTPGGRYVINCWWQSHLRCQQSEYTLLFLSLSLFSYIKRERLHNRMSKAGLFILHMEAYYCTMWARKPLAIFPHINKVHYNKQVSPKTFFFCHHEECPFPFYTKMMKLYNSFLHLH